jgi:hypothetical protein
MYEYIYKNAKYQTVFIQGRLACIILFEQTYTYIKDKVLKRPQLAIGLKCTVDTFSKEGGGTEQTLTILFFLAFFLNQG